MVALSCRARDQELKTTAMLPIFNCLSGRQRGFCALLILVLLGVLSAPASAASPVAEALFREGRKLMAKNQIDKACAKFAESQRVEASTGTLLNLATCHTKQGKTATAWVEFAEALAAAKKENDALRVDYAEAQMAALEPKLSKIMVSAAAPTSGMSITIDGSTVVLDSPLPFDPGSHTVKATAPGRTPFTLQVELAATAETKTVRIPELALEPRAVPLTAKAAPHGPEPSRAASRSSSDELSSQPQLWRKPLAYSLGGLGTAALGVGTYLALTARSELAEAESNAALCPGKVCYPTGRERVNAAETKANIATGAFAGGIAAVGVATYLLLTSPSVSARAPKRLSRHWLPLVSAHGAGLTVQGEFR
jgi:hypothetical protein